MSFLFFFKQKTAYEMRISDWSSDVCSSDLPNPEKLQAYGLGLANLVQALEANNANVGAGFIERQGEQLLIRVPGQVGSPQDIANIVLRTVQGTQIGRASGRGRVCQYV